MISLKTRRAVLRAGPIVLADALRAWRSLPQFLAAVRVAMIETSPALRDTQRETLRDSPVPLQWCDRVEDLPHGPLIVIANEFLDCLPIRQFFRGEDGWHEKLVGLDEAEQLTFGLSAALPAPDSDDEVGAVREIAPGLESIIYEIERRLHEAPGRALFIDYGYVRPEGADTLQALKNHRKVDPIETPGEADLVALYEAASGERVRNFHYAQVFATFWRGAVQTKFLRRMRAQGAQLPDALLTDSLPVRTLRRLLGL